MSELYHHGIKGQKWGVRRYQYADGSYTPLGRRRYSSNGGGFNRFQDSLKQKVGSIKTSVTGRQYVDSIISKGTTLNRIQSSENFEKFAFYATYKKEDSNKYMGLFSKNLRTRANYEAKKLQKVANETGNETDILKANEATEKAKNLKTYQLNIKATNKLRVPSDENASDIAVGLLKNKNNFDNAYASIVDSKSKMRRGQQQMLFDQALKALGRYSKGRKLSQTDRVSVYKALNLSLTNHNEAEISFQDAFYKELKKKGYNALLDYNDKDFSSYHAKRPMIVFDLDSVKLSSVTETNKKLVDKYYSKYNAERLAKEVTANTAGMISKYSSMKVSECADYVSDKLNRYLN